MNDDRFLDECVDCMDDETNGVGKIVDIVFLPPIGMVNDEIIAFFEIRSMIFVTHKIDDIVD